MNNLTWAEELIDRVLTHETTMTMPQINIEYVDTNETTGATFKEPHEGIDIALIIGNDPLLSQEHCFLHELAHWIVGYDEHHSVLFRNKAFELYELCQDKLNMNNVRTYEATYQLQEHV